MKNLLLSILGLLLVPTCFSQTVFNLAETRCAYSGYTIHCEPQTDGGFPVFFGFSNGTYNQTASPVAAYNAYASNQPSMLYAADYNPTYSGTFYPHPDLFTCSDNPCTDNSTLTLTYHDDVNNSTTHVTLQHILEMSHCGGKGTRTCPTWFWVVTSGTYTY